MPAANGTPTIFDKVRVGIAAIFGKTPAPGTPDAATLAGDKADLDKAVNDLETIFGPTVQAIEGDALGDVTSFLGGIAKAIPVGSVTSLSQIVNVVTAAAKALGGPIAQQIGTVESGALNTLVSAASVAAGHVNLTVA